MFSQGLALKKGEELSVLKYEDLFSGSWNITLSVKPDYKIQETFQMKIKNKEENLIFSYF